MKRFSIRLGFDWFLYAIPFLLICFGSAMIYAITYTNNPHLIIDQIIFAILGIGLMILFTMIDYRSFKGLAWILYFVGLILLILVLIVGSKTYGATRWINLGIFQLQPSEIFKLILIFILARFFSDRIGEVTWRDLLFIVPIVLVPIFLVTRQPDFGTASVLFIITIVITIASRVSKKHLLIAAGALILLIPIIWLLLAPYQKQRIHTFLNPGADPYGTGYNITQSTIAIGSGGLFGRGLGFGSQSQLNFLPVAHTDFIFAGIAEATGFIGSVILLGLFVILLWRIIRLAGLTKDKFGMLVTIGIAAALFCQVFVNIGMNLGIMPVTGIPLPFVSSGGTALFVNCIAIGVLQSIYIRHKKITF